MKAFYAAAVAAVIVVFGVGAGFAITTHHPSAFFHHPVKK